MESVQHDHACHRSPSSNSSPCSLALGHRSSSSCRRCCTEGLGSGRHVGMASQSMEGASSDKAPQHHCVTNNSSRRYGGGERGNSTDRYITPSPGSCTTTGNGRTCEETTGKAWLSSTRSCRRLLSLGNSGVIPVATSHSRQSFFGKQQQQQQSQLERGSSSEGPPAAPLLAASALSSAGAPALLTVWKTDLPGGADAVAQPEQRGGIAQAAAIAACAPADTETPTRPAAFGAATAAAAAVESLLTALSLPSAAVAAAIPTSLGEQVSLSPARAAEAAAGCTGSELHVGDSRDATELQQADDAATSCGTPRTGGYGDPCSDVVSSGTAATITPMALRSNSICHRSSVWLPTRSWWLHSSNVRTWLRRTGATTTSSSRWATTSNSCTGGHSVPSSNTAGLLTSCCSCGPCAISPDSDNTSSSRGIPLCNRRGEFSSCGRPSRSGDSQSSRGVPGNSRTTIRSVDARRSSDSCMAYKGSGETTGGVHKRETDDEARFYGDGKEQRGDTCHSDSSSGEGRGVAAWSQSRGSNTWRTWLGGSSSDGPSYMGPSDRKGSYVHGEGAAGPLRGASGEAFDGRKWTDAGGGGADVSDWGSSATLLRWLHNATASLWGVLTFRHHAKGSADTAWMKESPWVPVAALLVTILASQLVCKGSGLSSINRLGPAALSSSWLPFDSHLPLSAQFSPSAAAATSRDPLVAAPAATATEIARDTRAAGGEARRLELPTDVLKTDIPGVQDGVSVSYLSVQDEAMPSAVQRRQQTAWREQQQQVIRQLQQPSGWQRPQGGSPRAMRKRESVVMWAKVQRGTSRRRGTTEEMPGPSSNSLFQKVTACRYTGRAAAVSAWEGLEARRLAEQQPPPSVMQVPIASTLAFFCFLFFAAVFLQWLVSKIPSYPPPVSIVWFVFGMLVYGIASAPSLLPEQEQSQQDPQNPKGIGDVPVKGYNILQTGILEMRVIDSNVVYFVMVPILLYEATQNINWHKFKRFLAGGLTLAVLGVALQVGLLGVLFYFTYMKKYVRTTEEGQDPWTAAFLLASTLSSTDPVAVLSVLNAVNASDKLCIMFDGESLINDGSAVLLFQFFFFLLRGVTESPASTFFMFVKLLFAGPAFGCVLGFAVYVWLNCFRRFPMTQCLAVVTVCYMGYFVAEVVFSLSGPLTAVCYGLFIKSYGHIALDREAQLKHHTLVEGLALMGNCAIFIISGIVTYGMMSSVFIRSDGGGFWLNLFLTYIYLNLARAAMIIIFSPILRRTGYGLTWKEAVLLIWGGLRGGIVLALGLRIERDGNLESELTKALSFFISGSVFLILLIHGMTFELLYRGLSPYPPKPFRRVYLEAVMKMIDYQYMEERQALKNHWLFKGTDVLSFADKVVPALGWRKVDRMGNMNLKAPDITLAFSCLHEASLSTWVVPTAYTMGPSVSVVKRLDTAGIRMQQPGGLDDSSGSGDDGYYEGETEREGDQRGDSGNLVSPTSRVHYDDNTAVAAVAAELKRQQEQAQPPISVPSRSQLLVPPRLASPSAAADHAARPATPPAAAAAGAAGELSPADTHVISASPSFAGPQASGAGQHSSNLAATAAAAVPITSPTASPQTASAVLAAGAAATPAASRLHVPAQPVGTSGQQTAVASDAAAGGGSLGLRAPHQHSFPAAAEGTGVAVAAAETTAAASPSVSPEAQKQHHHAGAGAAVSAASISRRPSSVSRPDSEAGSCDPSRTPSMTAAAHMPQQQQQRQQSHLQAQQQHPSQPQPHAVPRDHTLTPRRPPGRLHEKEDEIVESQMENIRKEKHAHTLAALSQGLKPELPSATSAFDPKFNLRLIEHATTEDNAAGVSHSQQRPPHLSAPSFAVARGGEGGGGGVGGSSGRWCRVSREQLQQQYHHSTHQQRSTGRVESAAAGMVVHACPESRADSAGGETGGGDPLRRPASCVSDDDDGQQQHHHRRQFFPSPSGGVGGRVFLGSMKQQPYLFRDNPRGTPAAAAGGGSSSTKRLLSFKAGATPADAAGATAAALREADPPASSCAAVMDHSAPPSSAFSKSAPGSSAMAAEQAAGTGTSSRHSWSAGLLQAMRLGRTAATVRSGGEQPGRQSPPGSERLLDGAHAAAAAGIAGSKAPRRSRSRDIDSVAAAAAGAKPSSVTPAGKSREVNWWRTSRSNSSRKSHFHLTVDGHAEKTRGEAADGRREEGGGGGAAGTDGRCATENVRRNMHASVTHAAAYDCEWDGDPRDRKTKTVPTLLAATAGDRTTTLARTSERIHGKKRTATPLLLAQLQGEGGGGERQSRGEGDSRRQSGIGAAAAFADDARRSSRESLLREREGEGEGKKRAAAAAAAEHSEAGGGAVYWPPGREDSARRYDTDATLVFQTKGIMDQAVTYRRKRKASLCCCIWLTRSSCTASALDDIAEETDTKWRHWPPDENEPPDNRLAYRFHDLLHFPSLHRSRRASSESSSPNRTGSDRSGGRTAAGGGGRGRGGAGAAAGGGEAASRADRSELLAQQGSGAGASHGLLRKSWKTRGTSSEVLKRESSSSPRRGRVIGSATSCGFDVGHNQVQRTYPSWLQLPPSWGSGEKLSPGRLGEQTSSESALRTSRLRPGTALPRRPRGGGDNDALLQGLHQQPQRRSGGASRGYAELEERGDDEAAATASSGPCGEANAAASRKTARREQLRRDRLRRCRLPRRGRSATASGSATAAAPGASAPEGEGANNEKEKAAAAVGSSGRRRSAAHRKREEQHRTVTPGMSSSFHAGTTGAGTTGRVPEQRTMSMANLIRGSTSKRLAFRWRGRDTQSDTGLAVAAEAEGLADLKKSISLGSSESYFEIPATPRRGSFASPQMAGVLVAPLYPTPGAGSRRKVLRKEREGELYLMIFNACREMYHRLYHKNCIGGSALLSLNTSLDLSNDFAVGKVRQNPIRAWAEVLQEDSGGAAAEDGVERAHRKRPLQTMMTGFEFEWSVLQSRLHCMQQHQGVCGLRPAPFCFGRRIPSAFVRSLLNSGACQSDLEQVLAFVDVHEELLQKGGRNMEQLMGEELLASYNRQILSAKRFVLYIRDCYPDSFRFAICKIAATLLLNLKTKLVKDTAQKGLLLEEDKEKILRILDEQQFRVSRFRPCFIFIRPQNCVPAGVGGGFLAFSGDRFPVCSMSSSRRTSSSESDRSKRSARQQRPVDSHQHYHSAGSHLRRDSETGSQEEGDELQGCLGGKSAGAPLAGAKAAAGAAVTRAAAAYGSRTGGGVKGEVRSGGERHVPEGHATKSGRAAEKCTVTVLAEKDGAAGARPKSAAVEGPEPPSGVHMSRTPEDEPPSSGGSSTHNGASLGTASLAQKTISIVKLIDGGRHRAFASSAERQLVEEATAAIAADQGSRGETSRLSTSQPSKAGQTTAPPNTEHD